MINLILAIGFSASIGLIFKITEKNQCNRYMVTCANYLTATLVSFLMLKNKTLFNSQWIRGFKEEFKLSMANRQGLSIEGSLGLAVVLGIITGVIYLGGIVLYQKNVKDNGASLSATFMKLGIIIPIVLSILFFGEYPKAVAWIGIALSIIAVVIMNLDLKELSLKNVKVSLIVLMLIGGIGDFNSKFFQYYGQAEHKELFLFYIFFTALILSFIIFIVNKGRIRLLDFIMGIIVGIPNMLTSFFLIKALENIPGPIAFSSFSAGTIIIMALGAFAMFKEKLEKKEYVALAIIVMALILVNI